MLQVFHAKWYNRLAEGESSEGYDIVAELRRSSFVPHHSEDRHEIEMLKESLRQQDKEMRWRDEVRRQRNEAMRQRDDFYAHAFAQQQIVL
jgi:hypothetical protein